MKRKLNRLATKAAVAGFALAVIVTLGLPGVASANADDPNQDPEVYSAPMNLVGFDAEVAAAHGYEIRTTPKGRQYSVPVGTPADYVPAASETAPGPATIGTPTPMGISYGNCGYSYVYVYETYVNTGYAVAYGVFYSKWGVKVSSVGAYQDFNLDHGSTGPYWDFSQGITSYHQGSGYAEVNPGSYAVMTNGGTCYSTGPQDFHTFS